MLTCGCRPRWSRGGKTRRLRAQHAALAGGGDEDDIDVGRASEEGGSGKRWNGARMAARATDHPI